MKLKKIVNDGVKAAFGIRMVKNSEAVDGVECVPKISGLFLQDDAQEWTLTEKDVYLWTLTWIVPIKLVGSVCDLPVTWRSDWVDLLYGDIGWQTPQFFAEGVAGIVGYPLGWDSDRGPQFNYDWLRSVSVSVWAECNGMEYGPVTINFRR